MTKKAGGSQRKPSRGKGGRKATRRAAARSKALTRPAFAADLDKLLGSLQRFGRSHPVAVIGGLVLAAMAFGGLAGTQVRRRRSGPAAWHAGRGGAPEPAYGASEPRFAGSRSSFVPPAGATGGNAGGPALEQGYAGGGMTADSGSFPSSATDVSLAGSGYSGAGEPGAISTGGS